MNVVFTCGGTGGHINPAIAVANIWKERYPDTKFLFVGGGDDANMPTTEIAADKLVDGKIGFLNLMVACGLAPSNKQARQLVQQGGILVNDEKMDDPTFAVTEEMLKEGVKIRKGKKVFHKAVLA